MSESAFIETTRITSKGQATIPKSVRKAIGVAPGDRVSFVVCAGTVQIVNSHTIAATLGAQHHETNP